MIVIMITNVVAVVLVAIFTSCIETAKVFVSCLQSLFHRALLSQRATDCPPKIYQSVTNISDGMKRVFTVPERVHGGSSVRFCWQQYQGNYLAATGG